MGNRIKLIKNFNLYMLFIFAVIGVCSNKEEVTIISVVTFVLVSIIIQNYQFKDVLNNPYKVTAKIIREKNNVLTLEYMVENELFTTDISEENLKGYIEGKEDRYFRVGDKVDVYTSINFPDFIVPYCERTLTDKIVYTMIVFAGIIIDFSFISLSVLGLM